MSRISPPALIDNRAIWAIALPAMVTNVATALIGIGDMWIVGRLEDAATQGAVDIGARLFAVLFTVMNFLKTGTTGLVAQEGTRAGEEAQVAMLVRGLFVGLVIAGLLLLFKPVILPALLSALGARADVLEAARIYADIRYWTAPAVMANLALIGFLVGRRQMTAVLLFEVAYNVLNIALGLLFVLRLDMGIEGIGWSSFVAEYVKLAAVTAFVFRGPVLANFRTIATTGASMSWRTLAPFLSTNRDLFLRTVILMIALAALTRLSAERGPAMLAANGILYQLFVFTALLLDGFENAAQVLNGERMGARDRKGFKRYIKAILLRGFAAAAVVSLGFLLLADPILASFAATDRVRDIAQKSGWWLTIIPFAGVAGFVFDGVYVGASWTRALLVTMVGAALVFAVSLWVTWGWGNAGLWFSFTLFLGVRAALQVVLMPGQMAASFGELAKT
ncbi:MATE family efflux transporter [Erythrobacteraceae bacterium WH01K]|nr:MATE family efflux transporter [Erythrobacteraceae bacterium WH01K]